MRKTNRKPAGMVRVNTSPCLPYTSQISSFYAKLLIYALVGLDVAGKAKPTQTRREYAPCRLGFGIHAKDGLLSSLPSLAKGETTMFKAKKMSTLQHKKQCLPCVNRVTSGCHFHKADRRHHRPFWYSGSAEQNTTLLPVNAFDCNTPDRRIEIQNELALPALSQQALYHPLGAPRLELAGDRRIWKFGKADEVQAFAATKQKPPSRQKKQSSSSSPSLN